MPLAFAYQRTVDATSVCRQAKKLSDSTRNIDTKNVGIWLLAHDIVIKALLEFIGFVPDTATADENDRSIEGTILTLGCLDVFIAIALKSLRDDGLDCIRGHRRELYLDTFEIFLRFAYNQLIGVVRQFVIE